MNKEIIKRVTLVVALGLALSLAFASRSTAEAQTLDLSIDEPALWASLLQQAGQPPQAQGQPTAPAAATQTAEPTAEQKYKNIQTLKGLPAAQLPALMHLFNASLGVRCDHCHVRNANNEMEWDKDDKPDKKTARKMIQMTLDLNKASFSGRPEVTCYTCHQGHDHPLSIPALPAAIVPAEMPRPAMTGMPYAGSDSGKICAGGWRQRGDRQGEIAPVERSVHAAKGRPGCGRHSACGR